MGHTHICRILFYMNVILLSPGYRKKRNKTNTRNNRFLNLHLLFLTDCSHLCSVTPWLWLYAILRFVASLCFWASYPSLNYFRCCTPYRGHFLFVQILFFSGRIHLLHNMCQGTLAGVNGGLIMPQNIFNERAINCFVVQISSNSSLYSSTSK